MHESFTKPYSASPYVPNTHPDIISLFKKNVGTTIKVILWSSDDSQMVIFKKNMKLAKLQISNITH